MVRCDGVLSCSVPGTVIHFPGGSSSSPSISPSTVKLISRSRNRRALLLAVNLLLAVIGQLVYLRIFMREPVCFPLYNAQLLLSFDLSQKKMAFASWPVFPVVSEP